MFKVSAHQVLITRENNYTGMEFRGDGRDMLRLCLRRNKKQTMEINRRKYKRFSGKKK